MRKSYLFSMAIVLLALVGMMLAADMALKPIRNTLAIGRELTDMLRARGDVVERSKVVIVTLKAEERHLAKEGFGMIIELQPAQDVCSHEGRLEKLARRVVGEAARLYSRGGGHALDWYEVRLGPAESPWHRSLLRVGSQGQIERPEPAIPRTHVASAP
ncbi:MAG: hypothetical protein O2894_08645 [Planctomycetota bacterium]|nr:hypothetical protein [Planctomycetota bacterium]